MNSEYPRGTHFFKKYGEPNAVKWLYVVVCETCVQSVEEEIIKEEGIFSRSDHQHLQLCSVVLRESFARRILKVDTSHQIGKAPEEFTRPRELPRERLRMP